MPTQFDLESIELAFIVKQSLRICRFGDDLCSQHLVDIDKTLLVEWTLAPIGLSGLQVGTRHVESDAVIVCVIVSCRSLAGLIIQTPEAILQFLYSVSISEGSRCLSSAEPVNVHHPEVGRNSPADVLKIRIDACEQAKDSFYIRR